MSPEIHLFIIWANAGAAGEQVIEKIDQQFSTLAKIRIQWSPSLFTSNLSRFYGKNLPPNNTKERDCGRGPFTLVVVQDKDPEYETRETLQGSMRVNINCFDLKNYYRSTKGGSIPIHATNSEHETRRDLMLLFGQSLEDFAAAQNRDENSILRPLKQDLVGARGWNSIDELFALLNTSIPYVVLRNFDALPADYHTEGHGDVDLLVEDFTESLLLTNAKLVYKEPNSVHAHITIAGQSVPFDLRYVGDGYFDTKWQRRILKTRIENRGFFVPEPTEHFYSLLYHAAVHKPKIESDYAIRLRALGKDLEIAAFSKVNLTDTVSVRRFLKKFMGRSGYSFVRPLDDSVMFNKSIALSRFWRRFGHIFSQSESKPTAARWVRTEENSQTSCAFDSLLMPLNGIKGQRVLQVGCPTGEVSHFLASSARELVIVENDPVLANCAQTACSQYKHVEVLNVDALDYQPSKPFDIITIFGMAIQNLPANLTPQLYLQTVATHLRASGTLLFATGNPFGLQAWNGGKAGFVYSNTEVSSRHGVRAKVPILSHQRWIETLQSVGLQSVESYFLFPNLEDTRVIVSDAGLNNDQLNVPDLLFRQYSQEAGEYSYRIFAENLLLRDLYFQGALPAYSNGYLFVAQRNAEQRKAPKWLAASYNRGTRKTCYQVETKILPDGRGGLEVNKRRVWPKVLAESTWVRHEIKDCAYLKGNLLVTSIHAAMAAEASLDEVLASFSPWVSFLVKNADKLSTGSWHLPGDFIDCVPDNFLLLDNGDVSYFDREWRSIEPVPFFWVFTRGVIYSLKGAMENRRLQAMSYRDYLLHMAAHFELPLSQQDLNTASEFESRFASNCYPDSVKVPTFNDYLDKPIDVVFRLSDRVPALQNALRWHEIELARVKQTFSWRVTAPLRVIWNILRTRDIGES